MRGMGDEEKMPRLLQRAGGGGGWRGRVNWSGTGGGGGARGIHKIKMPLDLQREWVTHTTHTSRTFSVKTSALLFDKFPLCYCVFCSPM